MRPYAVPPRLGKLEVQTAALWPALADSTRRRILDLLLDRPRITGEIASHFPISRIAVMRHLQVLSDAGLVVSRKRGRERHYYLNAIPLQQVYQRWFDPHAAGWASGMLRLQRRLATGRAIDVTSPSIDIALDVQIEGTPAKVFAAITDPGGWWGQPMLRPQATALTLEPRLGGLFLERWENGGAVLGAITQWSPDEHLELTGPFHLGLGVGVATFDLASQGESTLLQFSFGAFGPVDADRAKQFSEGWTELIKHRLKALVEHGRRLGVAPEPAARTKGLGNRRRRDG